MLFRLCLLSLGMASGHVISQNSGVDLRTNSALGRKLMEQARSLNDENNQEFLVDYSVKFQGCHHVQQWNDNVDEEEDVRIKTKRLVRFRLCPLNSCSSTTTAGCNSNYGDYVVDMNTFVQAYLQAKEEQLETYCAEVSDMCNSLCEDNSCVTSCYYDTGFGDCLQGNRKLENIDVQDYAECAEYNLAGGRRLDGAEEDAQYYLGPYCADQGGEIHLGLFVDDTCTTFAQNGESLFYQSEGFALPYSDNTLVTSMCLGCSSYNGNGEYVESQLCQDIYPSSGKCETKMGIGYPNESSCGYIEGIKIIREDGIIRSSSARKSKAAAVCIGLFTTIAVLLAGYVYYLRTKLSRAKVNLAAASQSLA